MATTTYAIAIGSNRRGRHGGPAAEVRAAAAAIGGIVALSAIIATRPIGPSIRTFANAAALIETDEDPAMLLARLKRIEQDFGRRRGRRWGARVIDLDIVLWSGGQWRSRDLHVPHRLYATRMFVLVPLAAIARRWRDPVTGRTPVQAIRMVDRPRPRP